MPSPREDALRFLYSRVDFERLHLPSQRAHILKLDRMRQLLTQLGNPHDRLAIVHVAGTKGKGSTAAMVAAALRAAGYRVGLFTSPHLERIEERIAVDGRPCSPEEFANLVGRVRPLVEMLDAQADRDESGGRPTFFEITTAMAFEYFVQQKVDFAILEVGLGGRLDSTNVCQPRVAVITSVSFDHTAELGDTLAAIAREKAGIIKPRVPVVSGVTAGEAREVVRAVCRQQECPLGELGHDFGFTYFGPEHVEEGLRPARFDYWESTDRDRRQLTGIDLPLLGRHQAANAAVALAALSQLRAQGWAIPEPAVRQGFEQLRWPARIELVRLHPAVIVDAAHNVASVEALVRTVEESFTARRRLLLLATTRDKDHRGMLVHLLPAFDEVIFSRYQNNPRSVPPDELAAIAREIAGRDFPVEPDLPTAWRWLQARASAEDLLCATGSFFLAAEIRQLLGLPFPRNSPPSSEVSP